MGVAAIGGEQFLVAPLLHNGPLLENDAAVGIHHRGQPVSNCEHRAPGGHGL